MSALTAEQQSDVWVQRAHDLLEEALGELADDPADTVIGTVNAAEACLRAAWGEPVDPGLADWIEDRDSEPDCICPPDLRQRGGFTSKCPAHGSPSARLRPVPE